MQAFLKSRSRPASQPPEAGNASQIAALQITEDVRNGRWPFITEIVELTPGARAVLRHRLSIERDKLFRHHTLGRQVSECDAGLTGIPVVPLTVAMEIMAEAGAVLMPGQVLSGHARDPVLPLDHSGVRRGD